MDIQVSIPLDEDGFLRRECPTCERQFKWYYGQTDDRPDDFLEPEVYFCPYCGVSATTDSWSTPEQLEYMTSAAAGPILEDLTDGLKRSLGNIRSDVIKVDIKSTTPPEPPMPLAEPNDMMMVEPPCHPFEPLKVAEDWAEPLTCLMCGLPFSV